MCDMLSLYSIGNLTSKKKKQLENNDEFMRWYYYLLDFSMNRFIIEGLPDSCDEKTIKESLIFRGGFCLFKEDISKGLLSLPCNPTSELTIYGYSRKVNVFGFNGYNKTIDVNIDGECNENKGFYIKEYKRGIPLIQYILGYSTKISDCMRTLDVMRYKLKRPYIVVASEEVIPTVKKYFEKVEENENYIISSGIFDANKVQAINLEQSDNSIKNVRELIEWYFSQFLNICGVSTSPQSDKKERLLVDEIHSNDESTEYNVNSIVDYINYQLDFANITYGTNIKFKLNETSENDMAIEQDEEQEHETF